jgi:hypothetical protein
MAFQLWQFVDQALSGVAAARRLVAFWGPVADVPALLDPLLAIASALLLALLTGVAIGALSTLIVALVLLFLILREVFGVSIDLNPA